LVGVSVRRLIWTVLKIAALALVVLSLGYVAISIPRLEAMPQVIHAELRARGETWVPLARIPRIMKRAIVATEDQGFWTNWGISPEGIGRAVLVDLARGKPVQGGSTITQELVRDVLLSKDKTITRKVKEVLLALAITRLDSKKEILTMYLNEVYFGNGAYGINAASEIYFGRPPTELTASQATLLAGLPQAPSAYDPLSHPRLARARQRQVLAAMVSAGDITSAEAEAIQGEPWSLLSMPTG